MKFRPARVLLGIAFTSATLLGAAIASPRGDTVIDQLKNAERLGRQDDCRASLDVLFGVMQTPEFQALPAVTRAGAYGLAAYCALNQHQQSEAYRDSLSGTELDGASAQLWNIRLGLELQNKQHREAVVTVESMSRSNPDALNAIPVIWLQVLDRDLKADRARDLRVRLMKVLAAPAYQPDDVAGSIDLIRWEYAEFLVEGGDRAGAAAQVAKISDPSVLMRVSLDPQLRAMLPASFDVRAEVERHLAHAREIAAAHAGSLGAVLEVAARLRQLGRFEESLSTLEASRPDGTQASSFVDLPRYKNWWWDSLARSYEILGRYDDAAAAFRAGVAAKEYGVDNVSQAINLSHLQLRYKHPAEAVAGLARFGSGTLHASPYGLMEFHLVQGCGRAALGQTAAAKEDLAYAVAHERDHPEALMDLLLCLGETDAAAAAAIRRLDDPERRSDALLQFSDYDPPPSSYPLNAFEAPLPALLARADVQAAIARAGGTRRFHVQAGEL